MSFNFSPEHERRTLEKRYGASEAAFIVAAMMVVAEEDYEYVDNVRVARVGDKAEEEAYEDQKQHGCCGYYDDEVGPSPGGHQYRWGFNYGH